MADEWDSNHRPWNSGGTAYGMALPIMTYSDLFFQADSDFIGEETGVVSAKLERQGLPLIAEYVDPSSVKLIVRVWFVILGTVGDTIDISIGVQENTPMDAVTYQDAETFTIGTTEYIDAEVSGRFAAIKLAAMNIEPWTLVKYTVDFEVIGRH
jgi:hypothetical protein